MGFPVRAAARAVASPPALTIGYEAFSSRQRRKGEDDATSSARFCADQPDDGQRSQYDLRVRLRRGCPATPRHQVAHARQRLGLLGRILCIERPRDRRYCSTESAAFLLPQYLAWPENVRWTCPSGWWLGFYSHCLSTCPRARRSTSARATDCAGKRAFGNRVAAWPKLAPDRCFGYI